MKYIIDQSPEPYVIENQIFFFVRIGFQGHQIEILFLLILIGVEFKEGQIFRQWQKRWSVGIQADDQKIHDKKDFEFSPLEQLPVRLPLVTGLSE